tara:strand:+ start:13854 stop:14936 length:1083 start_codon:yes stop_codon:yes gene_type:complete
MILRTIFNKFVQAMTCLFLFVLFTVSTAIAQNSPLAVKTDIEPFGNHTVISQWGHVIVADQPDKATVGMYKDQDVKMVISIRGEAENEGYDERKAVEAAGMAFVQIPYMSGRAINGDAVDEILSLVDMTAKSGTKIVLHCTHSQRTGSFLGAALYKAGYSRDEANAAAKEAGMSSEFITKIHNDFLDSMEVDPAVDLTSEHMQTPFGNLDKTPQLGHVVYGRQPDEATIAMLNEQGIDFVLSARFDDEPVGFDSQKVLADNGISFKQVSFYKGKFDDRPRAVDPQAIDEISKILKETAISGQKVLFHCQSGQRAAGALAAVLVRDYGYSKENALAYAAKAGLTSKNVGAALDEYFAGLGK